MGRGSITRRKALAILASRSADETDLAADIEAGQRICGSLLAAASDLRRRAIYFGLDRASQQRAVEPVLNAIADELEQASRELRVDLDERTAPGEHWDTAFHRLGAITLFQDDLVAEAGAERRKIAYGTRTSVPGRRERLEQVTARFQAREIAHQTLFNEAWRPEHAARMRI